MAVYIALAGPTFYWLDSSEFVAAAWDLGVAHPPGHPLAALTFRLACYLPVGTIAFRVTLACALQAAAVTLLISKIAYELLFRLLKTEVADWTWHVAVGIGTLVAGVSYSLAFQAVRAEVYALNLALTLGATLALLRWDRLADRRWLYAAGLLFGLGLGNHHLLTLLTAPAFLLFFWLRQPRGARAWRLAILGGLATLGLVTLLYLPLRSRQVPTVDWGAPRTAERFAWVVSAKIFQRTVTRVAEVSAGDRVAGALFGLMGGLGPLGVFIALGGLYLLLRRGSSSAAACLIALLVAGNLASPLLVGFDPLNADAHGYISLSVVALSAAAAALLVLLLRAMRAWRRGFAVGAALLASIWPAHQAYSQLPQVDLRDHWAAEASTRERFEQAPGALLLSSYFETLFNAWALRTTADIRPDIDLLHRNFLTQPGYVEDLRHRLSGLYPAAKRWREAGHLLRDDLAALARERDVLVEYDLNLPAALLPSLVPHGPMLRFGRLRFGADDRVRLARYGASLTPLSDPETRRAATWTHYLLARFACRRARPSWARGSLSAARAVAPRDRRIEALARACLPGALDRRRRGKRDPPR